MNAVNWLHAHAALFVAILTSVGFVISELMPFLPTKSNGILEAILNAVNKSKEVIGKEVPPPKTGGQSGHAYLGFAGRRKRGSVDLAGIGLIGLGAWGFMILGWTVACAP